MGFCTQSEYEEFLTSCPVFEEMLLRSGVILIKYWFSVSDEEQERRFLERMRNPIKRWKLSPIDLKSRGLSVEYSKAKDAMLAHTDTKLSPWYMVDADNKKHAQLDSSLTCYNKFLTTIFDLSNSCCLRGSLKRDTHGRRNPRKTGCHSIFPDRIRPRQAVPLPVNLRLDGSVD